MNKKKPSESPQVQITRMVADFAGDKLEKVQATAQKLVEDGKSLNRALADALDKHKCPNTYPNRQDYQ